MKQRNKLHHLIVIQAKFIRCEFGDSSKVGLFLSRVDDTRGIIFLDISGTPIDASALIAAQPLGGSIQFQSAFHSGSYTHDILRAA